MFLFSVINGHEHIELFKDAPRLLSYLEDAKVEKAFLHKSEPANKSSIFAELKKGHLLYTFLQIQWPKLQIILNGPTCLMLCLEVTNVFPLCHQY